MSDYLFSGASSGPRDNFDAVSPPTVNDDASQGYARGSRWLNNTTGVLRICLDAAIGAAHWGALAPLDHPGYVAGRSYAFYEGTAAGGTVPAVDTLFLTAHYIKALAQIRALAFRVSTAGSADSGVKLGVWGSRAGKPFGAPLLANNDGGPTSAAALVSLAVAGLVDPGVVWVGRKFTGQTLPAVVSHQNNAANDAAMLGRAAIAANTGISAALTFPAPYADAMPTFASDVSFGEVAVTGVPIVYFTTGP